MDNTELAIRIENITKEYHLGVIGATTLKEELQRKKARMLRREDPTRKIGQSAPEKNERFLALKNVSFEIAKGETVGIIGHNGAGKSTLLKLISRVTGPTEGRILYNGRVVSMLEVGTGFHPELTGRENIYMNGAILGMTRREIDARIEDIIAFSECRQFIDTPVKRYSSGMYVKLAFSVAAHSDADIIIMDEVLAVGDLTFQHKCLRKMKEAAVQDGKTILYVSHNMNTIRQLCERCMVLSHGELIYDGEVEHAISLYLNMTQDLAVHYEYRAEQKSKYANGRMDLLGLDIRERKEAVVQRGEILRFTICVLGREEIKNARIRFEIAAADGSMAGTVFSAQGFECLCGEKLALDMELNTKNFAPGRYTAVGLAYESDDMGHEFFMDRVEAAMQFEVQDSGTDTPVWNSRYWGSVRFDDMQITAVRKKEN